MIREETQHIPAKMRTFVIDRVGEPGSFRELPTPKIGADEILVQACAAGINSIDWRICDGMKAVSNVNFNAFIVSSVVHAREFRRREKSTETGGTPV